MDVSVVVPTRNRSALLAMTLRSVLLQQDVELEVIVVDEASTDDTAVVLAALATPRLRVVRHETPQGVSAARNRGAAESRGEWLAFVDDDDLWAPDKLARQLTAARAAGRDWVYAGAVIIDARGRIVRAQRPLPPAETVAELGRYHPIPGGASNVAIRRTMWQHSGPFDTSLGIVADWELYLRLAKLALPACVDRPLIARRIHASNWTLDVSDIVRETRLIEALYQTTADWGRLHRWMAHSCLRAGQRRAALREFARAAVRGEGRAVVSDLNAILQQGIARRMGKTSRDPTLTDPWATAAAAWLEEFGLPTRDAK